MEGLVILLGEFLFTVAGGLVFVLGEFVALLVGLLVHVGSGLATRSAGGHPERTQRRWTCWSAVAIRRVGRILGGLALVTVVALVLLNTVWFESSFRWIAGRVAARTGIELAFAKVDGSYFSGRVEFRGLEVRRADDERLNYDFTVRELLVEVDPLRVLSRPTRIKRLRMEGLEGSVCRARPAPAVRGDDQADIELNIKLVPRKSFEIESLKILGGKVHVRDQVGEADPLAFVVELDSLESKPFRGGYALFDLLFRSRASGRVAECPFRVSAAEARGGRSTRWEVRDLPVAVPRHFVGGPFSCVTHGFVDVEVVDYWRLGGELEIDMHWALTLREVEAAVPVGLGGLKATLARAAVKFINERGDCLPLSFDLTINESEFHGAASLEGAGLFNSVAGVLLGEWSARFGLDEAKARGGIQNGLGRFRDFLDKKRGSD